MPAMVLSQIGPATGFLESLATAVGAGVVLGGSTAGAIGILARWPRPLLDEWALICGYAGALAGTFAFGFDLGYTVVS